MNDFLPKSFGKVVHYYARFFVGNPLLQGKLLPLLGFSLAVVSGLIVLPILMPKQSSRQSLLGSRAVLGASTQASTFKLSGTIVFNVPTAIDADFTANGTSTFNGPVIIKGKNLDLGNGTLTASNVVYNVKAGDGLAVSGNQSPLLTNTGVLSLQGQTGNVTLTAGSGISISGTTISNTQSSPNTFGTVSDGTNSFSAGSSNDTLNLVAGSGITISTDTANKKLTFSASGGNAGLSGLTTNGVLYATSGTAATTLAPGTSGYILQSNGSGNPPSWVANSAANPSFASLTTGTNTTATMTVGTGATLIYTGSGVVDANQLLGGTWAVPGTIGNTTPNTGAFTSLSSTSLTVNGNITLGQNDLNTITPNGLYNASIIPTSGGSVNLGSLTNQFGIVYAQTIYQNGVALTQYFQLNNGALSPLNISNDFLVGGNATSSAKFQVSGTTGDITATGVLSGLTGLTVNGSASVSGLLTLNSPSGIQTTNSQTLTLGGGTTGNITLAPSSFLSVAGNILPSVTDTYDLGSSTKEFNNIYVKNLITSSAGGVSGYWQLNSGALSPTNITNDLLVGGTGTGSAKFQVSGTTGNITATGTLTGLTGLISSGTVQFSGLGQGIAHFSSNGTLSSSFVDLTSDITNTLGVGNGGTGATSFTQYGILYGNGNGILQVTGVGQTGQVLAGNTGGAPTWQNLTVSGSAGGGGGISCTDCLVNDPTTSQVIAPTGAATVGLSVKQTSSGSPTADIFNVTTSGGTTKYFQIDANGNLSTAGTLSFTKLSTTTIGTNISQNWTLNGNTFNNRRSVVVTDADATTTLPTGYEVTLNITGSIATDICTNTQTNNNDLRISYGASTEIARNITRNCSTSLTITFLTQADIAAGTSDNYYIYYNNSSLASAGPTYASSTQLIDNADAVANFTTSDPTYTPISQDTVNKQEGTGSIQTLITGGTTGISVPTSTGSDGTLDLSLGSGAGGCTGTGLSWNSSTSTCTITVTTKSTYNFTTINIPSGTTLTLSTGTVSGTTPITQLLATGTVSIGGTVNISGLGYGGGLGPGAGGNSGFQAGGAGYGGAGTAGTAGATTGSTYTGLAYGSGGGTSPFAGSGVGGGAIQITTAGSMTVSGTINGNGTGGGCTGIDCGGGGSGGGIQLQATSLTVTGTLSANGGGGGVWNSGTYGGAGGGGRIWLDYINTVATGSGTITATGATTQAQTAGNGVILTRHVVTSYNQSVVTTKSAMDLSGDSAICFYVRSDTTGQYMQFGFGQSAITEHLSTITINTANTWQQVCTNIGSLSAAQRQNLTKFGFLVNNVGATNVNFWFDDIFAQSTAAFSGTSPTFNTGSSTLGTNNLNINAQGLGAVQLNYNATAGQSAGTGGLTLYDGTTNAIFGVDGSGNASASGALTLAGASQSLKLLNGKTFTIQTSPGGDAGLSTKIALLSNGYFGVGTANPAGLFTVGNNNFMVNSSGLVGIGTTSPLATLDVRSVLGTQSIASVSGRTSFAGLTVDNSLGDLFTASSSGTTRFVITQSGSVGVGTNNPTRTLDIVGNVTHSTSGTASQLSLHGTANSTNKLNIGYDTTSNYGYIEAVNESVAWQNLLLQPSGGNVGIGGALGVGNTSSFNASLDFGASAATNKIYLFDSGSAKYGFGANAGALQLYAGGDSVNNLISFNRYDGTTLTEMARIQNGTLAIGSSTFLAQAGIDVEKNALGNAAAVFNQTGLGDLLTASSSGSTKFTVSNNGNITNSGNITASGNINGINITGTGTLNISSYATMSASLSVGSYSAPAGIGNALFSGQVGIGTSSPTQTLSVAGNVSIYNASTGRGDVYTTTNLDHLWSTTADWNTVGATFSANMVNPATNNQLAETMTSKLASWTYSEPITINNTSNSNTLTNYQVQISVNTSSLITGGKMNSDCSDMRFTDSDGSTLLNYWIETGCNTTSTTVWVKVPSITASSNKTIYMYYGNGGATSQSSVTNTFIRDVSGISLAYREDEGSGTTTTDYSGNGNTGTYTGTSVVSGQFNNARNFTSGSDYITTTNPVTIGTTWTESAWINFPLPATGGGWRSVFVKAGGIYHSLIFDSSGNLGTYNNGWFSSGYNTNSLSGWHQITEVGTGGTSSFYVDGTVVGTASAQVQNQSVSNIGNYSGQDQHIGKLDEPRIYNVALTQAQITDLAANYGYVTTNDAGHELVRKFSSPEPSASVGSETHYTGGVSTDQMWVSQTLDAGAGNTYMPNYLRVNYALDGSDNIAPKFQLQGSNTGTFTGEQTVYPAGDATYYQNGGAYSISSGTQLDISRQVTSRFRYWKVIAVLNTGAIVTDTPTISSIELQDNKAAFSFLANGNVGLGTTAPAFKLDVSDGQVSTVAAMVRNVNPGASAGGLGIQLGATNPGTGNYFLSFLDGAGEIIGKIQGNGSGGVTYATTGIDFAEYYKKASTSGTLTPGAIVCTTPDGVATCTASKSILGVVSNRAGFAGGAEHADDPNYVLVGLVGQLPVKVASDAAISIVPGDPITTEPDGTATKAITSGEIVGHALTSSADSTDGTVMVSVNPSWYDPGFYTSATAGSNLTASENMAANNATITGTLNVLGRTTLTDLGVTGNITNGLLSLHGLTGEINTLAGDLKLQSEGLGGVDILNGLVTIDTSGNMAINGSLKAQDVTTDKLNITTDQNGSTGVLGTSAGTITIKSGQTTVSISTNKLTTNSLIFATPDMPVAVAAKKTGTQTFQIILSSPAVSDIHINWWIVN